MTANRTMDGTLGWLGILRLGLVQTALGAIVVLTTSTLNRIMVVELSLAATLPGALVALHYGVQLSRPRWGHGSDEGGRRVPWILGGMGVLAAGGFLAALGTVTMADQFTYGLALALAGFILIGGGVGAAGTSLLALLAVRTAPRRRAAAASIVWIMMIAGMAITATVVGGMLDPYSGERLLAVTAGVGAVAFCVTLLAVIGVERRKATAVSATEQPAPDRREKLAFREALAAVWDEREARRFTIFVFVSMLAYSAQDLILEPYAGHVFGFTPGESTALAGTQHGGVFLGMIIVALAGSAIGGRRFGSMRLWAVGGCLASAAALALLAIGGTIADIFPLRAVVFALGVANGAFAVAAIGSMMGLASSGAKGREGLRMGLWGAAQAVAFGLGGFMGTVAIDISRALLGSPETAYGLVFAGEGILFVVSAVLAARIGLGALRAHPNPETDLRGEPHAA
ncbi:MAG: BCD family MFS transporter [Pseudomonadota bacterium]